MRLTLALLAFFTLPTFAFAQEPIFPRNVSTFSIVACDPATGQMGVAVASRYFSVGSVVPWGRAGVGVIATQADVNVGYGPQGIDLLTQGLSAQQASERLLSEDTFPDKDGRQFAIADRNCNVVTHTGPNAPKWAGGKAGKTWTAQGNILVGPEVPEAMGKAFESTEGELAERMYAALAAGNAAGGDKRGRQSAAMLVVCGRQNLTCGRNYNNPRWLYINVDDNPNPFPELRRLLDRALAYNYGDLSYKLFEEHKFAEARSNVEKALHYAPNDADNHLTLAFLAYFAGDKSEALAEFRSTKQMDGKFEKDFADAVKDEKEFQPILRDKEFLEKVFPQGIPAELVQH
jgi:uncharacterized Ntn-hydrolase superfamily protein